MVRQFSREYQVREQKMIAYITKAKAQAASFEEFILARKYRENNSKVNSLSKLATSEQSDLEGSVYVQTLA